MTGTSPIPTLRVDSSEFPEAERFNAWRDRVASMFLVSPTDGTMRDQDWATAAWLVGPLIFNYLNVGPSCSTTVPARLRQVDTGCLNVRFNRRGRALIMLDDSPIVSDTDEILITDLGQGRQAWTERNQRLEVFIPYSALGYDPSRHPRYIRVPVASAKGRILESAMRALWDSLDSVTATDATAVADGFIGLLRGLISLDSADPGGPRGYIAARRRAMCEYLERHLREADLGEQSLLRAFGVSRATIYRDFQADGGLSHYIAQRRLAMAARELALLPSTRGRIRMIAERWGFPDTNTFSRQFRRTFGRRPSELTGPDARDWWRAPVPRVTAAAAARETSAVARWLSAPA